MLAVRTALVASMTAFGFLVAVPVFAAAMPIPQRPLGVVFVPDDRTTAWYLHPAGVRYPLARPADALALMRERGIGISNADIAGIPTADESGEGDAKLRERLAGQILLQVESRGESWYVSPDDRKRYALGKPHEALAFLRNAAATMDLDTVAAIPEAGTYPDRVLLDVPFVSQAPFGNWRDVRQVEGCEEASVLMAMHWARNQSLDKQGALREIIKMADYETRLYGDHRDTSAADTTERLFRGYFGYDRVELRNDVDSTDIREALAQGTPVLVSVNGTKLRNPHFRAPGPRRHMVIVIGYDDAKRIFLVNDPGTRFGASYAYSYDVMDDALEDYLSGFRRNAPEKKTAMIVVKKDVGR